MVYKTKGVCSSEIHFEIENDIVKNVTFVGGCAGNTVGVARLVEGMHVDDVIRRLEGIPCGFKKSSCPDQLATALKGYKQA
ncbi:MAG: TIGR03905 family TSCPD domain-containing protein [Lachnospiraceae bacterium]|nr:TIGR03905 family TSCPD domain-containing protein [Lachnospiraceae bacterium]